MPLLQKPLVLQPPKRVYSYATMQPILVVPPEDGRPVGGKKDGRNPSGSKATTHHHHSMKNSVKGHGMPRHRHPHGNTKDGESVIETHVCSVELFITIITELRVTSNTCLSCIERCYVEIFVELLLCCRRALSESMTATPWLWTAITSLMPKYINCF